jgi:hypothetical protein
MLTRRFDLSGGVQIKSNKYLMNRNQVLRAQNVISPVVGSFTKRKGYTQLGTAMTASNDILMNTEFQYGTTPTRKHIAVCDNTGSESEVHVNVAGTWTQQAQNLTAGNKARGTDFVDYFFLVNYADATRSYDGTTWSTATNVTSAPKAKFIESYRDRLYLGYCNVSSTAYPSRVYYSSLPDASHAITWDTTNDWFYVETNDGDVITGLAKNKVYLIIFKENSMHRYDGTQNATNLRPISWNLGAVSQESIVVDENLILFYSRKGVCMFSGAQPKVISRAIQPIIDRVNQANLGDICAGLWGDHYLCYVGTLTSALPGDSSALTNVVLDYDISQNSWTYHTVSDTIRTFGQYTSSGKKLLSFGDANGEMFTWDSGTTDDGTAIATNVELVMWPSGPETMDTFQSIYFFGNSDLGDVDWQFKVDGGSYSTAVDLSDNFTQLHFADSSIDSYGRELGMKFSESGGTAQWQLDGFSVETATGGSEIKES